MENKLSFKYIKECPQDMELAEAIELYNKHELKYECESHGLIFAEVTFLKDEIARVIFDIVANGRKR